MAAHLQPVPDHVHKTIWQRANDCGASVVEWVIIVAVVAVLAGSLAAFINNQVNSRAATIDFGDTPSGVPGQ